MSKLALIVTLVVCCWLDAAPLRAESASPALQSLSPVAMQIGTTAECELRAANNLAGASAVLVSGEGVVGHVVPETKLAEPAGAKPAETPAKPPNVEKIKLSFTVAAGALPGAREVRVVTPRGVSSIAELLLVRDPVVAETTADNGTLATAQAVTLPATICGAIEKAEDVDVYKFHADAGKALTFHVQSSRLENKIHDLQDHADPMITLRGPGGEQLAANDNYFFADPLLYYRFAAAGDYYLEIRDLRYKGNVHWKYAIEIHDRPFAVTTFPLRVVPGETRLLTSIGFNLPADPIFAVSLPADTPDGIRLVSCALGQQPLGALPVVVDRLPDMMEAAGENGSPATAQPIPIPAGVSGRIEQAGDIDCYSFAAKAGQKFSFEVLARRVQSELDSHLRILNDNGERLAENDDLTDGQIPSSDSRIEAWTAPADGRYVVEIRDLNLRGGPGFGYFLKATRSQPFFTLETDSDKTLLAPGASAVIFVRAYRRDGFTGEIQLAADGLPPSVTAHCGRILSDGKDGCIILTAAAGAPAAVTRIRVSGSATQQLADGRSLFTSAVAQPLADIYAPGGSRMHYPVGAQMVSVSEPADIRSVKLSSNSLVLAPGKSEKVEVTVERRPGFAGNVSLDVLFQHLTDTFANCLPPGVTVDEGASRLLLPADQTSGTIALRAAPDARPVEKQQVAVMASVSINFVDRFTISAEPLTISVVKP